jgi:hypothetical protein
MQLALGRLLAPTVGDPAACATGDSVALPVGTEIGFGRLGRIMQLALLRFRCDMRPGGAWLGPGAGSEVPPLAVVALAAD